MLVIGQRGGVLRGGKWLIQLLLRALNVGAEEQEHQKFICYDSEHASYLIMQIFIPIKIHNLYTKSFLVTIISGSNWNGIRSLRALWKLMTTAI